jgi:hypothetical protein
MHTTWSSGDCSIVPEQTVALIASLGHARTVGISDHFEHIHDRFEFVVSSDAHQPNWINQTVARHVAARLGVRERLLFDHG